MRRLWLIIKNILCKCIVIFYRFTRRKMREFHMLMVEGNNDLVEP